MPNRKIDMTGRAGLTLVLMGLVFFLSACRKSESPDADSGVLRSYAENGVELRVRVSAEEMLTSEMLDVDVEVVYPFGHTLQLPEADLDWGDFSVFESRMGAPEMDRERRVRQRISYSLEPDIAQTSVLPAYRVKLLVADGKRIELASEPIGIEVRSVLAGAEKSLREIAPDERPVAVSEGGGLGWEWLVALVILSVAGGVLIRVKRNQKPVEDSGQWQIAFEALAEKPAAELTQELEPCVARMVAARYGLVLSSCDFSGLKQAMKEAGREWAELDRVIFDYQKLEYGRPVMSEEAVSELYTSFAACLLNDGQGKEVSS